MGIVTAPEDLYNSSSLLRNHQSILYKKAVTKVVTKVVIFKFRRVLEVSYNLRRLLFWRGYSAWGSISPGLAEDLQVACGSVAVSIALLWTRYRGLSGDSRWTMLSAVRVLPSASSYLSLVASPST